MVSDVKYNNYLFYIYNFVNRRSSTVARRWRTKIQQGTVQSLSRYRHVIKDRSQLNEIVEFGNLPVARYRVPTWYLQW